MWGWGVGINRFETKVGPCSFHPPQESVRRLCSGRSLWETSGHSGWAGGWKCSDVCQLPRVRVQQTLNFVRKRLAAQAMRRDKKALTDKQSPTPKTWNTTCCPRLPGRATVNTNAQPQSTGQPQRNNLNTPRVKCKKRTHRRLFGCNT